MPTRPFAHFSFDSISGNSSTIPWLKRMANLPLILTSWKLTSLSIRSSSISFAAPIIPGGRVWTKEEVEKVGLLCQKHGVILISDEIHQDMALFGHKHFSFNTVSPDFKVTPIILGSATKTFNIARDQK